ncbi:fungal-specific transcription factor domain-containing protein [Hygrophoropsis aurantiaca]|uniref:Fungal-specific transcription factor domain-containing protein n=1 Tax=Hygrophoropsis aurantiaca TaxID=72124 RepID=A0ACB8ANQ6_9AGAM|nr:fungal-specific transcription factor domain-containing protein [Hygrophoropsis aurantiaca]
MSAAMEDSKKVGSSEGGSRKTGLSCSECRRSKLKCDRVFPCQSCVRRGCAAICPDGTLAATKGNKVLMAHAQRLTEQVRSMADRIKELESALEESQRSGHDGSGEHPLLQGQNLQVTDVSNSLPELQTLFDQEVHEVSDAIGSLSIGLDGQAKYHGESAGSEYFQELLPFNDHERRVATDPKYLGLPFEIIDLCNAFPFGLKDCPYGKYHFLPFIPDRGRALRLVDLYYENFAWMYNPIVRSDFYNTVINPIYGTTGIANLDNIHSHRLSVFFILLASGSLYDNAASATIIAEQYHALSRAALSLDSILQEATCATVQALFMCIRYIYQSDRTNNEGRWLLMGVCARVAQIIGLQRDSAGWNLGQEEVQRRRNLFWEIYTFDAWTSVVNGRPPALAVDHTDCRFPEDLDAVVKPSGAVELGWHLWKFRYSASCLSISVQHVFSTRTQNYSVLLELDRKIRKFMLPTHLQSPIQVSEPGRAWSVDPTRAMQQYCALCERECNLLYIHRSYFAQAIRGMPDNPLGHKYAPSVLAVYRSASRLISSLKGLYAVHPIPTSQQWFFWSGIFSACIVLGALVIDSSRCSLAQNALQEFDQALVLYDQGSKSCRPPATLPMLEKLRHRAFVAFTAALSPPAHTRNPAVPDELEVLGGRKTVITNTSPSNSPSSTSSGNASTDEFTRQLGSTHPSLLQYYQALGDPGLVLPATKEFDMSGMELDVPYDSGANTSMRNSLNTPSPFYDPMLQASMARYAQESNYHQNISQASQPAMHYYQQPHPQLTQQHTTPETQPHNQEEVWRDFIHHLDLANRN